MVHDNQHGAMDKDTIQRSTRNRQVHPPRDAAALQEIGEKAGFAHVGELVAGIVQPLIARRELERALANPAGFPMELRTKAVELAA